MRVWLAERLRDVLYGLLVVLFWPLVAALFRLSVRGRAHLKVRGILVAPHRSYWDIPVLCAACGPFCRVAFVARTGLLRNPSFAPLVWGFATIINREEFSREDLRKMLALDKRARLIGIFPEGTTRPGAEPKPGAVWLAERTGRPLIPVNLVPRGPYPPKRWGKLPVVFPKVEVRIGKPVTVEELGNGLPQGLSRPERYRQLADRLMVHILAQ